MRKISKIELTKEDILEIIAEKFDCDKSKITFTYVDKCVGAGYFDGVKLTKDVTEFDGATITDVS